VRRSICLCGVALVAALVVAAASATESTIYPGVGIGKVKLGMTLPQVEHILGKDSIVNERRSVAGVSYRELVWNFGGWSVGFLRTHGAWHAVQVETTLRGQRTAAGVGVGSPFKQVVQKHPAVFCGAINPTYGPTGYLIASPTALILISKGPVYTAFAVEPSERGNYSGPWEVFAVVVQQSVRGHFSLGQTHDGDKLVPYHCKDRWRERGTPS
jgi:hypothetical protein